MPRPISGLCPGPTTRLGLADHLFRSVEEQAPIRVFLPKRPDAGAGLRPGRLSRSPPAPTKESLAPTLRCSWGVDGVKYPVVGIVQAMVRIRCAARNRRFVSPIDDRCRGTRNPRRCSMSDERARSLKICICGMPSSRLCNLGLFLLSGRDAA